MQHVSAKDPSTLAALQPAESRGELHYRQFKNSVRMHGSHIMSLRRPSRIPEGGRQYVPRDPVQLIDWKAYARTDQLIIRERRDEAAARILIGFDMSETMQWPPPTFELTGTTSEKLPCSKAEIATRIALNLAHMHLRMGDLVEIWLVQAQGVYAKLMPRSPSDVVALFARLERTQFAVASFALEFSEAAVGERAADAAFWIGDCLGPNDYRAFLARGRKQILLHVLSSLELDIDWVENDTAYFDDGEARREYQGQVLRPKQNYAASLMRWRERLADTLRKLGGDYFTVSDQTAIAQFQMFVADALAS